MRGDFHRGFERALAFATQLHAKQTRKKTDIPCISHLIAVVGLVLENGGDRDQAIAALRKRIKDDFGPAVLEIVEGCTDADALPKPPFRDRKKAYIAQLESAPQRVLPVSCADNLHNARAIVADLRVMGPALFERKHPAPLAAELKRTV